MIFKKTITLFFFSIIASTTYSQQMRHIEDSIRASTLIADKLKSLNASGASKFLYLFSDAGTIAIVYEIGEKIKGVKCYYKGKQNSKFSSLRLSKDDKSNYNKCMNIVAKATIVSFSNCKDFVHSFNRIVFKINTNGHFLKGNFTSDCSDALERNNMLCLFNIYQQLLL